MAREGMCEVTQYCSGRMVESAAVETEETAGVSKKQKNSALLDSFRENGNVRYVGPFIVSLGISPFCQSPVAHFTLYDDYS
jgi:hypothetical protein